MAIQLCARNSVDRIAAHFDLVFPETYQDENRLRASVLTGGTPSEIQIESLKLILYLVSNNLLLADRIWDLGSTMRDSRLLISLCRLSGFAAPRTISGLVRRSYQSPTLTSIINVIFRAAVYAEAADIVSSLLAEDHRICPDQEDFRVEPMVWTSTTRSRTPLVFAVTRGSVDLVTALLNHGADIHQLVPQYFLGTPVNLATLAIFELPSGVSGRLVELLLRKGVIVNNDGQPRTTSALQAAIMMCDIDLVDLFITKGADLGQRWFGSDDSYYSEEVFDSLLDIGVGCLGLAASGFLFRGRQYQLGISHPDEIPYAPKKPLAMCDHILDKYSSQLDLSNYIMTDAIIVAASRGYTDVMSLLYRHVKIDLDSVVCHDSLSPIYAAVRWNQPEACQLLLDLGASPRTNQSRVSLLHLAIRIGSSKLVEVLLQFQVEIDELCYAHIVTFFPPLYPPRKAPLAS